MFYRLDNNNSRIIDFDEFLELMTSVMILGNALTMFKKYFSKKMVKIL